MAVHVQADTANRLGGSALFDSVVFDDPIRFPPGSITLDCALAMRNVPVDWHAVGSPLATELVANTGHR